MIGAVESTEPLRCPSDNFALNGTSGPILRKLRKLQIYNCGFLNLRNCDLVQACFYFLKVSGSHKFLALLRIE